MNELVASLDPLGRDLHRALSRVATRRARRRRTLRVTAATAILVGAFAAVAVASGIGLDLQLDPMKWAILGSGSVDNGRGQYVHAQDKATGGHSSFSVEHDAGMPRYDAFLLYVRLQDAENKTAPEPAAVEPGPLCTADQLTRAEVVALATLRPRRSHVRRQRGARGLHAGRPAVRSLLKRAPVPAPRRRRGRSTRRGRGRTNAPASRGACVPASRPARPRRSAAAGSWRFQGARARRSRPPRRGNA